MCLRRPWFGDRTERAVPRDSAIVHHLGRTWVPVASLVLPHNRIASQSVACLPPATILRTCGVMNPARPFPSFASDLKDDGISPVVALPGIPIIFRSYQTATLNPFRTRCGASPRRLSAAISSFFASKVWRLIPCPFVGNVFRVG